MKKSLFLTALITVAVSANASQSWPVNNVENIEVQTSKYPIGDVPVTSWPVQIQSTDTMNTETIQGYCEALCVEALTSNSCRSSVVIYVADINNHKPVASIAFSKTEDGRITSMPISNYEISGTAVSKPIDYLCLLVSGHNPHNVFVEIGDGVYTHDDVYFEDDPYDERPGNSISCHSAYLLNSRVGMMMALDTCLGCNISRYRNAMRKTKIRLIRSDYDVPEEDENNPFGVYDPIDIVGYRTHLSFMEYIDFLNNLLLPLDSDPELSIHYAALRKAMADHVRFGAGHLAYDWRYEIAAMTDVSFPDGTMRRTATLGGYYPAESPQYLLAIAINKRGNYGLADVCELARKVVTHLPIKESAETVSKPTRYHPAERGR